MSEVSTSPCREPESSSVANQTDESLRPQDRRSRKSWTEEEKAQFWKAKRAEKKARKKERSSAKREVQQANWEKLSEEEKRTLREKALALHEERQKHKQEQAENCRANFESSRTPIIVFDLAFWSTMNTPGKKSTIAQIKFSYSALKGSLFSFKPVFTSFDPEDPLLVALRDFEGFKAYQPEFYEAPLQEVFAAKRQSVVYLSADSKNLLETVSDGMIYVIGSFVDHNSQKGATENAAKAMQIETARLPIAETLKDIGNICKVLTVNHVTDCLVTFKSTNSWERAFEALPTRRREEMGSKATSESAPLQQEDH